MNRAIRSSIKCHFIYARWYQTITGDGEIIAKISTLADTGTSMRVGVMIRDTLAANSKHICLGMTGANRYRFSRCSSTAGGSTTMRNTTGTGSQTWVRLVRTGLTTTAYWSNNGTTWNTIGSNSSVSMASTCYIGLVVSSGSVSTLNTSQFSNVTVTP